jgi:hypothetical protein
MSSSLSDASQKDLEKGPSSTPGDGEVMTADDGIRRADKGPLGVLWKAAKYLDSFGALARLASSLSRVELTAFLAA